MSYSPTVVKSAQQGTIALINGASATATITAVNVDKTILSFNGTDTGIVTANTTQSSVRMSLTNSTTVTATRATTANSVSITPQYRVVEFY